MRYLIISLLLSFSFLAEAADVYATQYVWAKSGLTMRAGGSAAGARIMIIPFGAAVEVTDETGEFARVTDLPGVSYSYDNETVTSDAYVMESYYVLVNYQGKTGFVYAGYLSRFPPAENDEAGFHDWLSSWCGTPEETEQPQPFSDGIGHCQLVHYPNGVLVKNEQYEGGGSTTIVFPGGSLNDGYLIAAKYLGVRHGLEELQQNLEEGPDMLPELLKIAEDGSLDFSGDMSSTVIRQVGGVLVIHASGGC